MYAAQVPIVPVTLPGIEYSAILPELIMAAGALVLLATTSLTRRRLSAVYAVFTALVAAGAAGASFWLWERLDDEGAYQAFGGAIAVDGFGVFIRLVLCATVAIGALVADAYLRREDLDAPEFHVLAMLSASGAMLMASANDLILLFLGLEILSISLYVLAAYHRWRAESGEAGIKYFVLGAFSSAFLLYGIALVYGATGSTNLAAIAGYLAENVATSNGVLLAGMALLLVGLGFKVAAVPFHTWTPDVYEGAPTPVTGFMASAAKAAGFAGLLRVFFSTFNLLQVDWRPIVWVLAVLTMVVGSVLAVVQTDIKRMLAYSSISHAGYVLIGLQAASREGIAGALFYVLAYTFMVLGSFGVVTLVGRRGDADHDLEAYRGLARRRPGLALAFTVFLMAQAGVPLTSGFFAKFYVISAAVDSRSYAIALIAMLAAVVAAFFYLRVVILMYGGEGEAETAPIRIPAGAGVALAVTLAFTVGVGILPGPFLDFARHAELLF